MIYNTKYKTSYCRYWETSKLISWKLPNRREMPLRPWRARAKINKRRFLTSHSQVTLLPNQTQTTTSPSKIITKQYSANTT